MSLNKIKVYLNEILLFNSDKYLDRNLIISKFRSAKDNKNIFPIQN